MVVYYFRLALKSIRKSPVISSITVAAIALGIAVATTILSLRHVMGANPMPHKSEQLFNIRLDSWELESEFFGPPGEPPKHITYRDMRGLMRSDIPDYQTGIGKAAAFLFPDKESIRPFRADIRLCHSAFFPMFEVPFQYGGAWTKEMEEKRARVTVLSHDLNQQLFDGADSVGKSIRLGPENFTILGVLAPYRPTPQYYDVLNNSFGKVCDVFVPFDLILEERLAFNRRTQSDGFGYQELDGREAQITQGNMHWIQFWVQLTKPSQVQAYHQFVDDYSLEQKKLGLFPRPLNNRVTPMMEWLAFNEVSPPALNGMVIIGFLFLLVCALNLMGLLLGKFLAGANAVGVRRALGASKGTVFLQHIAECLLVGLAGGLLGAALTSKALRIIYNMSPPGFFHEGVFRMDLVMLGVALLLSLLASAVAGVYPAWRACNIQPAVQIKLQ